MKIETAGIVSHKYGTKFCVIVKEQNKKRVHIYGAGDNATVNSVELLAMKFATLGVKVENAIISTPNQYVSNMLKYKTDGKEITWELKPKSNKELIEEIRELVIEKDLQVVFNKSDEARQLCREK